MNVFEKFLDITNFCFKEKPALYSPIHLVFIAIMIGLTVWMCVCYRDTTDKKFRKIIFGYWIVMALFEIYKNLQFSCHTDGTTATWSYPWYIFPFQFCSTPLYILPVVIFAKDGKVRDAALAFSCAFALFAGLAVFAYPSTILIKEVLITIQSLVHHGFQVVTGIFILSYCRKKLDIRFLLKGIVCFICLAMVALGLNLGFHAFSDETFDMFFISPYFACSLPLLSLIDPLIPYPVFLLIYLLGFSLAASIVYYSGKGIYLLTQLKRAKVS